ncbi:MAG: hypothetical protein ACFFE8_13975 [Candidatus Heimdallarchaeota archaeon]
MGKMAVLGIMIPLGCDGLQRQAMSDSWFLHEVLDEEKHQDWSQYGEKRQKQPLIHYLWQ